jgi:hypothetical protein
MDSSEGRLSQDDDEADAEADACLASSRPRSSLETPPVYINIHRSVDDAASLPL